MKKASSSIQRIGGGPYVSKDTKQYFTDLAEALGKEQGSGPLSFPKVLDRIKVISRQRGYTFTLLPNGDLAPRGRRGT